MALKPAVPVSRRTLFQLAASVQAGSEHPLARAVVALARAEGIKPIPASEVSALPGRGIAARVDGCTLRLGNRRLVQESSIDASSLADQAAALQQDGRTVSWLFELEPKRQLLGMIAFGDAVKASAKAAVAALHRLGIRTVISRQFLMSPDR